jgi:hypothetical protein
MVVAAWCIGSRRLVDHLATTKVALLTGCQRLLNLSVVQWPLLTCGALWPHFRSSLKIAMLAVRVRCNRLDSN